jgi:hypothetical protein
VTKLVGHTEPENVVIAIRFFNRQQHEQSLVNGANDLILDGNVRGRDSLDDSAHEIRMDSARLKFPEILG